LPCWRRSFRSGRPSTPFHVTPSNPTHRSPPGRRALRSERSQIESLHVRRDPAALRVVRGENGRCDSFWMRPSPHPCVTSAPRRRSNTSSWERARTRRRPPRTPGTTSHCGLPHRSPSLRARPNDTPSNRTRFRTGRRCTPFGRPSLGSESSLPHFRCLPRIADDPERSDARRPSVHLRFLVHERNHAVFSRTNAAFAIARIRFPLICIPPSLRWKSVRRTWTPAMGLKWRFVRISAREAGSGRCGERCRPLRISLRTDRGR